MVLCQKGWSALKTHPWKMLWLSRAFYFFLFYLAASSSAFSFLYFFISLFFFFFFCYYPSSSLHEMASSALYSVHLGFDFASCPSCAFASCDPLGFSCPLSTSLLSLTSILHRAKIIFPCLCGDLIAYIFKVRWLLIVSDCLHHVTKRLSSVAHYIYIT